MVLFSVITKHVNLLEQKVPLYERMEEAVKKRKVRNKTYLLFLRFHVIESFAES